jgi:hypothetical protein
MRRLHLMLGVAAAGSATSIAGSMSACFSCSPTQFGNHRIFFGIGHSAICLVGAAGPAARGSEDSRLYSRVDDITVAFAA